MRFQCKECLDAPSERLVSASSTNWETFFAKDIFLVCFTPTLKLEVSGLPFWGNTLDPLLQKIVNPPLQNLQVYPRIV